MPWIPQQDENGNPLYDIVNGVSYPRMVWLPDATVQTIIPIVPSTPAYIPGPMPPGLKEVLPVPPVARFTYTVYANRVVAFRNGSVGKISSCRWTFGDGTSTTERNPSKQYGSNGTFTVSLIVTGPGGYSAKIVNIPISWTDTVASFTYTVGNLSVQFTDTSTQVGTRNWNFGDGNSSTEDSPHHVYAQSRNYLVTLSIGSLSTYQQVVVDRGIGLSWQDNSDNETGFKIEHSLNGSDWTLIATTTDNPFLVTFNLHGVYPTKVNYFRICATNAVGDSAYSNTITTQCS